jgi:hypothetical protein
MIPRRVIVPARARARAILTFPFTIDDTHLCATRAASPAAALGVPDGEAEGDADGGCVGMSSVGCAVATRP